MCAPGRGCRWSEVTLQVLDSSAHSKQLCRELVAQVRTVDAMERATGMDPCLGWGRQGHADSEASMVIMAIIIVLVIVIVIIIP